MEFMMNWRWLIATVIVFGGIAIIAAIGHRRTQRLLMAARTGAGGGGDNASGSGSDGQPPTVGGTKTSSEDDERGEIQKWLQQENLWKNWLAFPTVMLVLIAILAGIIGRFVFPHPLVIFGTPIRPELLVFFGLTAWLFSHKENVEPEQWGIKKFFGRIVQDFGAGPTLVPPALFTAVRFPILQHSIQIAAAETKPTIQLLNGIVSSESQQQCLDALNEVLEVNFAPPEHAIWVESDEEKELLKKGDRATQEKIRQRERSYTQDPLNTRLTAKVRITVLAKIDQEHIREFAQNIGTIGRAILELNTLVRAVVGRWCGKRTAAFVSRNLGLLGREILNNTEDLVGDKNPTVKRGDDRKAQMNEKPWGYDIIKTEVHPLEFPVEVNVSVADIAKARAEAQAKSKRAEGEKAELTKKGIGAARAVRAMNFATTSEAGKYNVAMKTLAEMVQKGNVVFTDSPIPALAAQLKAGLEGFQPPKAQQHSPDPKSKSSKGSTV